MPSSKLFNIIKSIKLENVTKKYNGIIAVDKLDLQIKGGQLLILIGPSGSGKTTTLRMINRLVEPDEGEIFINNTKIAELNPVLLRRNIGYVIQEVGLFSHMTIGENIGLLPKLEGWSSQKIENKVNELLHLVSLHPEIFRNRYPRELSGGQQQRVGLARALALNAPLLLMDEPFGALDPILRKQLQNEFLKIKKELNKTIIFVTHDIDEAFKLGDKIAIIDKGKLIQVDEANELLLNPTNDFVADMVDAKRKFKYIDNLLVKDMMITLDDKYIFEASMSVKNARKEMMQRNIELLIIIDKSELIGWNSFRDLFVDDTMLIKDISKKPIFFEKDYSMTSALAELKKHNQPFGIVTDKQVPIGLLLFDELLSKLI